MAKLRKKPLRKKVIDLLRKEFRDLTDGLETTHMGRVTGAVVSPDFARMDDKTRQDRLKQALANLPPEDQLKIGPIVALTPEEANIDVALDG